ncbi:hypothetical protein ACFV6E_32760 [Streptomyces sp. NPDC059785]
MIVTDVPRNSRNSGIVHVERILFQESSTEMDLDVLIGQFLTRLRAPR